MPNYRDEIIQGTPEWLEARLGKFTGSDFHTFLGDSKTKKELLFEKVAERMFHDSDREEFSTFAMERGKILEIEARKMYSEILGADVKETGLVDCDNEYEGFVACSPDGLVGDDGIIEIKCPLAKNFLLWTEPEKDSTEPTISYIKPEYKTQIQFNLFVTERQWCDLIYYHPRGGLLVKRIYPDPEHIEKIKQALDDCIAFVKQHTGE